MDEVIILGSGTPEPVQNRAGAAIAVTDDDGSWVLIDCGRAATQRALDIGLDPAALVAVLITHHHSDHLGDLATFATIRWSAGATSPLMVVAPSGPAVRFAQRCLEVYEDDSFVEQAPPDAGTRPRIDVRAFDPASEVSTVLTEGRWNISAVLVEHGPIEPAVGYLVEHEAHRVAVSGDTSICDGMRALGRGADALVHEAVGSERSDLRPSNASAHDVGVLAAEAQPGIVVLTHMIPAPESPDMEERYEEEVRASGFTGTVVVGRDLLRVPVGAW